MEPNDSSLHKSIESSQTNVSDVVLDLPIDELDIPVPQPLQTVRNGPTVDGEEFLEPLLDLETSPFIPQQNPLQPRLGQPPSNFYRVTIPRNRRFVPVRIHPLQYQEEIDPWAPTPTYTGVTARLSSGSFFQFDSIQDDTGCSPGLAVSSSDLEERLRPTDAWCWSEYDWTHKQGMSKAAVCQITIPSIGLDTYSFVHGVDGLTSPTLGRFLVLDVQSRIYVGSLANPLSLPLDVQNHLNPAQQPSPVSPNVFPLSSIPDWNTIKARLVNSEQGRAINKNMTIEYKEAIKQRGQGALQNALIHFQRVSVWGFFVFSDQNLRAAYTALAMVYRQLLQAELAVHWAKKGLELGPSTICQGIIDHSGAPKK